MMYVGMLGVYRTAPLLVAGIAGASPVLERPLARCYVSADATHREPVLVHAAGFSGGSLVDVEIDGRRQTPAGVPADATGRIRGEVPAPHQRTGQRRFRFDLVERGNPAHTVTAWSRVTALAVDLHPRSAPPSAVVRYRGRGFVGPGAVYAHYLRGEHVMRSMRLATPRGACGTFSVRARQIPVERPATGLWTVHVDQSRRYEADADPVYVRLTIDVRRSSATS
jgi:hypothetical protein